MTSSRVYAISDLHIDYPENLEFVRSWSNDKYRNDVLIVAGDVTDNLQLLETTLRQLKKKFAEVFFVPGKCLIEIIDIMMFMCHEGVGKGIARGQWPNGFSLLNTE